MQALLDGDIFAYEVGFAAEWGKEGDEIPSFDYVQYLLESLINRILVDTESTKDPIIYLTGKGNFREKICTLLPYKGNRDKTHKPFHYNNIRIHLKGAYNAIEVEGIEADDAMSIHQMQNLSSVITCSRDKDLKMVPGWHYSWELHNQPSWGPYYVVDPGWLELQQRKNYKTLHGVGKAWFYAQCLTGDKVDNIPGIPKCGPVKAYNILKDFEDEEDLYSRVLEEYCKYYKADAEAMLLEQGRLLWMIREVDENNNPIMWELPS